MAPYSIPKLQGRLDPKFGLPGPFNVSADTLSPIVQRSIGHGLMVSPKEPAIVSR